VCGGRWIAALLALAGCAADTVSPSPPRPPGEPPVVTLPPLPEDLWDDVIVPLTLRDAEADKVALRVEWSEGGLFRTATPAPGQAVIHLASSKSGAPARFVWQSRADVGDRNVLAVTLRVVASDVDGDGSAALSTGFHLRNRLRLSSASPGDPGERIELGGRGFGSDPAAVRVIFPGVADAVPPVLVADDSLQVDVPGGVHAGPLYVELGADQSNPIRFVPPARPRFVAGPLAPPSAAPVLPTLADVDGDGLVDLIQGLLYRNAGAAGFTPVALAGGAAPVLAADVDGDGRCDLVVLPAGAPPSWLKQQAQGAFTFQSAALEDAGAATGAKPAAALFDADGDGLPDLLVAGALSDGTARSWLQVDGELRVQVDPVLAAAPAAVRLAAFDANLDGRLDILLGGAGTANLLLGTSAGVLAADAGAFGYHGPAADRIVLAADLDGDGSPDLLTATPLRCFHGLGGSFVDVTSAAGLYLDGEPTAGALADVNDDGLLDLFLVAPGRVWLLVADGAGRFVDVTASSGLSPSSNPTGALAADLDGDGRVDLYDGERLWWNRLSVSNGWVEARVSGRWAGAHVVVTTPDGVRQSRAVESSALPLHFGLGAATSAELEVRFAGGQAILQTVASGDRLTLHPP
jgi:hypothetical protein